MKLFITCVTETEKFEWKDVELFQENTNTNAKGHCLARSKTFALLQQDNHVGVFWTPVKQRKLPFHVWTMDGLPVSNSK